jgi:hypothetical protein
MCCPRNRTRHTNNLSHEQRPTVESERRQLVRLDYHVVPSLPTPLSSSKPPSLTTPPAPPPLLFLGMRPRVHVSTCSRR